jgi:hypothetical protein
MCVDRGMTGKMIELLKASNRHDVMKSRTIKIVFPRNHLFARILLFAVGHVLWKGAADHEDAPKKTIYVPARKNDM